MAARPGRPGRARSPRPGRIPASASAARGGHRHDGAAELGVRARRARSHAAATSASASRRPNLRPCATARAAPSKSHAATASSTPGGPGLDQPVWPRRAPARTPGTRSPPPRRAARRRRSAAAPPGSRSLAPCSGASADRQPGDVPGGTLEVDPSRVKQRLSRAGYRGRGRRARPLPATVADLGPGQEHDLAERGAPLRPCSRRPSRRARSAPRPRRPRRRRRPAPGPRQARPSPPPRPRPAARRKLPWT